MITTDFIQSCWKPAPWAACNRMYVMDVCKMDVFVTGTDPDWFTRVHVNQSAIAETVPIPSFDV